MQSTKYKNEEDKKLHRKDSEIYNLREVFLLYNSIKVINVIKLCLVALSVKKSDYESCFILIVKDQVFK